MDNILDKIAKTKYHGKPCKDCGNDFRYISNNQCVECAKRRSRGYYLMSTPSQDERRKRWLIENPEPHREMLRAVKLAKSGMTVGQYDDLLALQGGVCAICRLPCTTGRRLAIDHDHSTNRVRGLLCQACNLGIGKFKDDPARLEAAIAYLRRPAVDLPTKGEVESE